MIQIKTVQPSDFDAVYPILQKLSGNRLNAQAWQGFFHHRFEGSRPLIGLAAWEGDRVVGFLGTLYSRRRIAEHDVELCNISSWVVDERHQGVGLALLAQLLKEKDVTYTSFSAGLRSYPLLKRFGFEDFFTKYCVFPFCNGLLGQSKDKKVIFDSATILPLLDEKNRKILEDHGSRAGCFLMNATSPCLCLLTIVKKKGLRFALLHYISDKRTFCSDISSLTHRICKKFNVAGLLVFKEYLGPGKVKGTFEIASPVKGVFRSNRLRRDQLDSLYSEFFVLP